MKTESTKPSKELCIRAHFSQRCYQRIGYVISQEFLLSEREKGKLELLMIDKDGRELYKLKRKFSNQGRGYTIVYDKEVNLFVSVYPYKSHQIENKKNRVIPSAVVS